MVAYAVLFYLLRFKLGWSKLIKTVLLVAIFRVKYWQHYGCQLAWSEVHFGIDRVARKLLVREYYQEMYSRLSWISNASNAHQVIIY